MWSTIDAFVDALGAGALPAHVDVRPALRDLLRTFWEDPTPDEALAWGSFPWEEDLGDRTAFVPFAPPLRLSRIVRHLRSRPDLLRKPGLFLLKAQGTQWTRGTRARSRGALRAACAPREAVRSWGGLAGRALARAARRLS